ncbi:MAG TPA: hypothetical protein VFJ91_05505 [Gaiellaceae bacterium]|nr:hypothetical protein [Gaiellaceae bacterium]
MLVYAGVLAYALWRSRGLGGLVATLGGIGALLLVVVLWKSWTELLSWSLATLGGAYAATLFVNTARVDEGAPLLGAGLLLCGELAALSLEGRWRIHAEVGVLRGRLLALAVLLLAGLAAAAAVVAAAGAGAGRGLAWTTLGAAAVVAVVGTAVALLRRAERA